MGWDGVISYQKWRNMRIICQWNVHEMLPNSADRWLRIERICRRILSVFSASNRYRTDRNILWTDTVLVTDSSLVVSHNQYISSTFKQFMTG